jgi:hypothetical protein
VRPFLALFEKGHHGLDAIITYKRPNAKVCQPQLDNHCPATILISITR